MKILILSFFFPPDLSAGSFRTIALVDSLRELMPAGSQIDIVTTLPNRYHSFTAEAPLIEQKDGLSIVRIPLPKHQSGMLDQSKAFLAFTLAATKQVAKKEYDIVFATSGRLMTAVLGACISRWTNARLYLDIRDIFVESIQDVLPRKFSWVIKPVFSMLEKWTVKQADKVNLVSFGFSEYFNTRYPKQKFSYFTNAIDDEFLTKIQTQEIIPDKIRKERPLTVVYAGNMGEGQGLHIIIPELAKLMGSRVHFKLIGDGGRKQLLESVLLKSGVTNVELFPPVKRSELLKAYQTADVLFLHLNDYDAFKKVLPSKIFEYAALGKPVWAGISGYSADFVKAEISNSAVFPPCDADAAIHVFETLNIQTIVRNDFIAKYSRVNISREMAKDILKVAIDNL